MVTDDENSAELEETTSFDGESSSCFFSEEEIDNCLDSPHIEYNFTDLKKIGAGGFGSVYEAVHTIEDKKYALKFVKIFSLDFDKREVKILASLNHPNVLRYYTSWITPFHKWSSCSEGSGKENSDSIVSFEKEIPPSEKNNAVVSTDSKSKNSKSSEFIYDACLVIQTELCNPNKNLEILIHEGEIFTMSDKKRLNLFLDIVSGLEYMHSKGIMHRDLKPSNILLDIDNRAKIGDFGFARKCKLSPAGKTSENEFSQNVGTCLYVAPEVRDSNIYDKNADIYSLGMILFEMYHKMGSRMERIKIMEKLRNQEFSDLKNIPAQFKNVRILVKSLLSHDPQLRKTLKRIIKLMSPLEQQQRLRGIKIHSRPMSPRTNDVVFCDYKTPIKRIFERLNEIHSRPMSPRTNDVVFCYYRTSIRRRFERSNEIHSRPMSPRTNDVVFCYYRTSIRRRFERSNEIHSRPMSPRTNDVVFCDYETSSRRRFERSNEIHSRPMSPITNNFVFCDYETSSRRRF